MGFFIIVGQATSGGARGPGKSGGTFRLTAGRSCSLCRNDERRDATAGRDLGSYPGRHESIGAGGVSQRERPFVCHPQTQLGQYHLSEPLRRRSQQPTHGHVYCRGRYRRPRVNLTILY